MNSKHIPGNVKADLLMTEEEPVDYRVLDKPAYPDIINEDQNNIDMLSDKICIDNQQVSGIMNSKHIPGNVKADLLMTEEEPVDYRVLDKPVYPDIINEDQNNIESINTEVQNLKALFNKLKENTESQDDSDIINAKNVAKDGKECMTAKEKESVNQLMYRNKLKRKSKVSDVAKAKTVATDGKDITVEEKYEEDEKFINPLMGRNELKGCHTFMSSKKQLSDSESEDSPDDVATSTKQLSDLESEDSPDDVATSTSSREQSSDSESHENWNDGTTSTPPRKQRRVSEPEDSLNNVTSSTPSRKQLSDLESEDSPDDVATSTSSREQSRDSESHENWNDGTTFTPPRKQRRVSEPEDSLNDVTSSTPSRKRLSDYGYEQNLNDATITTDFPNITDTHEVYEGVSADNGDTSNAESNIMHQNDLKSCEDLNYNKLTDKLNEEFGKQEASDTPESKERLNDVTTGTCSPIILETIYEDITTDDEKIMAEYINKHQNNNKALDKDKFSTNFNDITENQEVSDIINAKAVEEAVEETVVKAVEAVVREVTSIEEYYVKIENFSIKWKEKTDLEKYRDLMKSRNNIKDSLSKKTLIIGSEKLYMDSRYCL
ncbi:hypothetical protein CEXT_659531 [Caerostris extrusa]|uniref:Uncharacterized protein n=1 Tax=Caerostris extrusa TaxID=172846 RepID=A0AAV4PGM6_CAEEX|nr:hypothetical protein CEXT_659531 [Caerostris extrusa]